MPQSFVFVIYIFFFKRLTHICVQDEDLKSVTRTILTHFSLLTVRLILIMAESQETHFAEVSQSSSAEDENLMWLAAIVQNVCFAKPAFSAFTATSYSMLSCLKVRTLL